MNINAKRVAAVFGALVAGSVLLVPALPGNAGVLPDPDTVPCEAFGAGPDCIARRAQRSEERRCGLTESELLADGEAKGTTDATSTAAATSADEDIEVVDVIAHTNRL